MRKRLDKPQDRNKGALSQSGVALIMALFAILLMVYIAVEVGYDASVNHAVAAQQVNRIKAYYAAKSGVELSLLRLMMYKKAAAAIGKENVALLEPIWKFPFAWPPIIGDDLKVTEVDKGMIKSAVDESLMEAQYATTIESEGGKIDINDLGSPVKTLREATATLLLRIFETEMQNNDEFKRKYGNERFNELVNNITDWIDEDSDSLNGGAENRLYENMEDSDKYPPNRAFRTMDELHQVAGMKDDFYNLLLPRVTIFGTMGISVNYAPKETLMALDASMTSEAADELIKRRSDPTLGGPFKTPEEFLQEAQRFGVDTKAIQATKIPLLTEMEYNFRIVSTGTAANVRREITVVTFDFENLSTALAKSLDEQDKAGKDPDPNDKQPTNPPGGTSTSDPKKDDEKEEAKPEGPKGRPTVVYWEEN